MNINISNESGKVEGDISTVFESILQNVDSTELTENVISICHILNIPLSFAVKVLSNRGLSGKEIVNNLQSNISSKTVGNLENNTTDMFQNNKLKSILASDSNTKLSCFINAPMSTSNLRSVTLAMLTSYPVIVQGASGSGKSFLIRTLANLLGKNEQLLVIHLDDQTDSKALIGAYICSDVPGEFLWQPGLITQAVTNGYWLLIEGIDHAPLEVVAALSSLLDRRFLRIPSRGIEIHAHTEFRLFATRTTTDNSPSGRMFVSSLRSFNDLWCIVHVTSLPHDEVEVILEQQFPSIVPKVRQKILDTYKIFGGPGSSTSPSTSTCASIIKTTTRQFTLRDVIKVAHRISSLVSFNQVSGYVTENQLLECLSEVIDTFVMSTRDIIIQRDISYELSTIWSLQKTHIDGLLYLHAPQISLSQCGLKLQIGRAMISRSNAVNVSVEEAFGMRNFARTRHALRLLERVARCVSLAEPVLLVGETGSGKTTVVQELANLLHHPLLVQNLSLSTDSSDLIGGFRPVPLRQLFQPTYELFVTLFQDTFSQQQNTQFLHIVGQSFHKHQWSKLLKAFLKASLSAQQKLQSQHAKTDFGNGNSEASKAVRLIAQWEAFKDRVARLEANLPRIQHGFAFAFTEGLLVRALRSGSWLLLDEVNLAAPETLQALAGVLEGQSLSLSETGDLTPIERHCDFRVFAAMNPPTDVGKRELSEALRSRFTEIFVGELTDAADLRQVVQSYLDPSEVGTAPVADIVDTYLACRLSSEESLVDGAGQRPRYSLRSLTRSLRAAKAFMSLGIKPISRALYEGLMLNFQTLLGDSSRPFMRMFLQKSFSVSDGKNLSQPPPRPGGKSSSAAEWILIKPFWLRTGPLELNDWAEKRNGIIRFVMTPTVEENIRDLCAAIAADVAPILLQGPTSVGKTTMVEYVAARTGHHCIRINNHEHTDVQEYIGGYVSGIDGQLQFQDGLLVQALRQGHWLILDELNLAPSDVLEALNRLLDDNKELLIPETGEVVKPTRGFKLFATQNPPGAYGGRKPLSRAFRNRFIEMQVGDLPAAEVELIVSQSCGIPPKFGKMLVRVMTELQLRRHQSSLFQGRHGAVTIRDLIKWGRRKALDAAESAEDGFMLLAERLRREDEKRVVQTVLEQVCGFQLSPDSMYDFNREGSLPSTLSGHGSLLELMTLQERLRRDDLTVEGLRGIAVTKTLRRAWRLAGRAVGYAEPVLLIGETGSGKTSVCQLIAAHRNREARILNCHQGTETADIIGGLRPVRGRELHLLKAVETLAMVCNSSRECGIGADAVVVDGLISKLNDSQEQVTEMEVSMLIEKLQELIVSRQSDAVSPPDMQTQSMSDVQTTTHPTMTSTKKKKRKKVDETVPEAGAGLDLEALQLSCVTESKEDVFSPLLTMLQGARESLARYRALFEWQDGPLVEAMIAGGVFVLDEINLADDAVIERLNSVLESGRSLTLAEKGSGRAEVIVAHPDFRFIATMNPGGDFGKRELSPALRSRFTEIWIPNSMSNSSDLCLIIVEVLHIEHAESLASTMVWFMNWVNSAGNESKNSGVEIQESKSEVTTRSLHQSETNNGFQMQISVREVLAWANFIAQWRPHDELAAHLAMLHGLQMVLLDGLGMGLSLPRDVINRFKCTCMQQIIRKCPQTLQSELENQFSIDRSIGLPVIENGRFHLGQFSILTGNAPIGGDNGYVVNSMTTLSNMHRISRAMQLPRPILLEGPPGVGKTSLISTLARLTGHNLVRINLSEHSELSDLLGTDLPNPDKGDDSDDGSSPKFDWCDGAFLTALRAGDWVLLDELNLAPQTVLEGLNACFDHREEVFIPEIGKTFHSPPTFRVFCAQNPTGEGGRKGLPQSFLTRFSRVYIEAMCDRDLREITQQAFCGRLSDEFLSEVPQMVTFVQTLQRKVSVEAQFARLGSPWEFNLRDLFRCCELIGMLMKPTFATELRMLSSTIGDDDDDCNHKRNVDNVLSEAISLLFLQRMRSQEDYSSMNTVFEEIFGRQMQLDPNPVTVEVSDTVIMIGLAILPRRRIAGLLVNSTRNENHTMEIIRGGLDKSLEGLAFCVMMGWHVLLIGSAGSGKKRCVRHLARLTGNQLLEFSASSSTDSTELLGSFEQINPYRHLSLGFNALKNVVLDLMMIFIRSGNQFSHQFQYQPPGIQHMIRIVSLFAKGSALHDKVENVRSLILEDGQQLFQILKEVTDDILSLLRMNTIEHFFIETSEESQRIVLQLREDTEYAITEFEKCLHLSRRQGGGFEWVDGVVVEALTRGLWLLIDNVNLCSASVLDRLNSLLEPGGSLFLTECGNGRRIVPHRNFRIFFTMDPCYGEISRAMRNRCVEIALFDTYCDDVAVDFLRELFSNEASPALYEGLLNIFSKLSKTHDNPPLPVNISRFRSFVKFCSMFQLEAQGGAECSTAIGNALSSTLPILTESFCSQELSSQLSITSLQGAFNRLSGLVDVSMATLALPSSVRSSLWLCKRIWQPIAPVNMQCEDVMNWYAVGIKSSIRRLLTRSGIAEASKRILNILLETPSSNISTWSTYSLGLLVRRAIALDNTSIVAVTEYLKLFGLNLSEQFTSWTVSTKNFIAIKDAGSHIMTLFPSSTSRVRWTNDKMQRILQMQIDSIHGCIGSTLLTDYMQVNKLDETGSACSNAGGGSSINTLSTTKSWRMISEIVIFHRFSTLYDEKLIQDMIFDSTSSGINEHSVAMKSLFGLTLAVGSKKLNVDFKELSILSSLNTILNRVDSFVHESIQHFVENRTFIPTSFIEAMRLLLQKRDMLSLVLRKSTAATHKLPWEGITVCMKWLKKCSIKFKMISKEKELTHTDVCLIGLDQAFLQYDNALEEYWRKPTLQKAGQKLWMIAGHASVPLATHGWKQLEQLRHMLDTNFVLPSLFRFVDSVVPRTFDGSEFVRFDKDRTRLLHDWLFLYCTFYWAQTTESVNYRSRVANTTRNGMGHTQEKNSSKQPIQQEVDFDRLLSSMTEKLTTYSASHAVPIRPTIDSSTMLDGEYEVSTLFFDENIQNRVVLELEYAGQYCEVMIAEELVIKLLLYLSDKVSNILLFQSDNRVPNKNILIELQSSLKVIVNVHLTHTYFSPKLLRELQSLSWSIDMILCNFEAFSNLNDLLDVDSMDTCSAHATIPGHVSDPKTGKSGDKVVEELRSSLSSFFAICRVATATLELMVYSSLACNVTNSATALQLTWNSPTLSMLLEPNPTLSSKKQDKNICLSDLLSTGIAFQMQPVCIQTMLRLVDVRSVLPPYGEDRHVLNLIANDTAVLTISCCKIARKRLLNLFKMTVRSANELHKYIPKMNTPHVSSLDDRDNVADVSCNIFGLIGRVHTLQLHALDIIQSCSSFISSEIMSTFSGILGSSLERNAYLFQQLVNLDISSHCPQTFLSLLFEKCLHPLLIILANEEVYISPHKHAIGIGRGWVLSGLLRVLLVMPSAPVDPATRVQVKADLLNTEIEHNRNLIATQVYDASIAGEAIVTPMLENLSVIIEVLQGRVTNYCGRAVLRPEDALPFSEVFNELHAAVEGLATCDRLIGLMMRTEQLFTTISRALDVQSASESRVQSTKAFEKLSDCAREEVSWQDSCISFISRAEGAFRDFEDVTSPVFSALQAISFGLRLAVGYAHNTTHEMITQSNSNSQGSVLEKSYESILQVPYSMLIPLRNVNDIKGHALTSISSFLCNSKLLVTHSIKTLQNQSSAQEDIVTSKSIRTLEDISPHVTLLLLLARIDYYVGGGTLVPSDVNRLFAEVLSEFTNAYLEAEDKRKKLAAEEASLFKHKAVEHTLESDEVKEELDDLRSHFPDHLESFVDITGSKDAVLGDGALGQENRPVVGDNADGEYHMSWLSKLEEHTAAMLVGFHSRMVLIYGSEQLRKHRHIWTRCAGNSSGLFKADQYINPMKRRSPLLSTLSAYSLLAIRTFDIGLKNVVHPALSQTLLGGSLMSLAIMADQCSDTSANSGEKIRPHASVHWCNNSYLIDGVDIDMLLLIGYRAPGTTNDVSGTYQAIDFHSHPNQSEAIRVAKPLQDLFHRSSELLMQYPGHEILVQICRIAGRIAEFHITTPLGKMLASIELLLRKAEEWEQYAASHVSLQSEMRALGTVISRWRTIELQSWEDLLRCKEQCYSVAATKHWFALVRCMREAEKLPMSASSTESTSSSFTKIAHHMSCGDWSALSTSAPYWLFAGNSTDSSVAASVTMLKSVFEAVDSFLRTAIVGEFPTRLHIIKLFALQFLQEAIVAESDKYTEGNEIHTDDVFGDSSTDLQSKPLTNEEKLHRKAIGCVIFGVWQYYEQFLVTVRKFQTQLRIPLQQKFKDEVKLGKWDQLSTFALVEHSERVHRKLNKLLREYDTDVLKYPVAALLKREIMSDFTSDHGELQTFISIPPMKTLFPALPLCGSPLPTNDSILVDEEQNQLNVANDGGEKVKKGEKIEKRELVESTQSPMKSAVAIISSYIRANLQQESFVPVTMEMAQSESHEDSLSSIFPRSTRLKRIDLLSRKMDKYLHNVLELPEEDDVREDALESDDVEGTMAIVNGDEKMDVIDKTGFPNKYASRTRHAHHGADIANDLCEEIFGRIARLRAVDLPRNIKQRAIGDLFRTLKAHGISSLRSRVAQEMKHLPSLLSVAAPLAIEIAGDFTWSSVVEVESLSSSPRKLSRTKAGSIASKSADTNEYDSTDRAERYYIRCLGELNELRTQVVATFSPDISHRDAQVMVGLAENMFCLLLRSRCVLSAALQDMRLVMRLLTDLESTVCSAKSQMVDERAQLLVRGGSVALDSLIQLQLLLRAAVTAHSEAVGDGAGVDCGQDDILLTRVSPKVTRDAQSAVEASIHKLESALMIGNSSSNLHSNNAVNVCNSLRLPKADYSRMFSITNPENMNDSFLSLMEASLSFLENGADAIASLVSWDVFSPILTNQRDLVIDMREIVNNTEEVLQSVDVIPPEDDDATNEELTTELFTKCADNCLIAIQKLKAVSTRCESGSNKGCFGEDFSVEVDSDEPCEQDVTLLGCLSRGALAIRSLGLEVLSRDMSRILKHLTSPNVHSRRWKADMHALSQLVRRVLGAHDVLLTDLTIGCGALGKLSYIVLRIFRNLLAKGICAGKEEEGDGEGGEGNGDRNFEDNADGTGMGEGEGKRDVSDEIENEEQLLGLKDEAEDGKEQQSKDPRTLSEEERDQGVEMAQDFEGELCDVPEGNEDDQNEDEEDEGKEELDRDLGDADDADVVDEKEWGDDDDEEEGPQQEEKFEKDSKTKGDEIEGEMHTKEDDNEKAGHEDGDEEAEKEREKEDGKGNSEEQRDEDLVNNAEDTEEVDKPLGVDVLKEEEEEGEQDADKGGEGEQEGGDAAEEEAFPEDMKLEGEGDDNGDEGNKEEEEDVTQEQEMEGETEQESADAPEEEEDKLDDKTDEDGKMDISGAGGQLDAGPEEAQTAQDDEPTEEQAPENELSAAKTTAFGIKNDKGKSSLNKELEEGDEGNGDGDDGDGDDDDATDIKPQDGAGTQGGGLGSRADDSGGTTHARDRNESGQGDDKREREIEAPNPFLNRGDINQQWYRRLQMTPPEDANTRETEDTSNTPEDGGGRGMYEYAPDESATEQVLGPVTTGEEEPVGGEGMETDGPEQENGDPMDSGEMMEEEVVEKQSKKRGRDHQQPPENLGNDSNDTNSRKKRLQSEQDSSKDEELEDSLDSPEDVDEPMQDDGNEMDEDENLDTAQGGSMVTDPSMLDRRKTMESTSSNELIDDNGTDDVNASQSNQSREIITRSEVATTDSRRKWSSHRTASEGAAARLCEQLRLVLEPTLASRLHGDYRTGKRINMRRVVGYVASGCRKDKIWLRRTKPAKRDYQIMVMMDDSKSMAGVAPLALSALATLSGALNRLEVGQLGVTSFSDRLSVLHPFGPAFDDEAGAAAVARLTFTAEGSALASSLRDSLALFAAAKAAVAASVSASSAVQLCFVISDARLDSDNRAALRAVVRESAEQHILVVLVIIDKCAGLQQQQNDIGGNYDDDAVGEIQTQTVARKPTQSSTSSLSSFAADKDSIFNTKTVEFTSKGIVTKSYLEDFPFPYYVAVRRPEVLPELLADVLRQWFELVRAQMDNN